MSISQQDVEGTSITFVPPRDVLAEQGVTVVDNVFIRITPVARIEPPVAPVQKRHVTILGWRVR